MNNLRCLYDSSEKQIIVLKQNYECLMWKLPSKKIENLNPFQLFEQHYLKTMNEYLLDDFEKASKLNQINAEIIEAWNCSDVQVREEYEKLCQDFNTQFTVEKMMMLIFYILVLFFLAYIFLSENRSPQPRVSYKFHDFVEFWFEFGAIEVEFVNKYVKRVWILKVPENFPYDADNPEFAGQRQCDGVICGKISNVTIQNKLEIGEAFTEKYSTILGSFNSNPNSAGEDIYEIIIINVTVTRTKVSGAGGLCIGINGINGDGLNCFALVNPFNLRLSTEYFNVKRSRRRKKVLALKRCKETS